MQSTAGNAHKLAKMGRSVTTENAFIYARQDKPVARMLVWTSKQPTNTVENAVQAAKQVKHAALENAPLCPQIFNIVESAVKPALHVERELAQHSGSKKPIPQMIAHHMPISTSSNTPQTASSAQGGISRELLPWDKML